MTPLVPADLDLRDFQYMPLDVVRLVDSDLSAIATGDEFKAAVWLWCKAWHQVPASSLPNDDRMLALLAGYGRDLKEWRKVRETALRGFVLCDDGRLYHPVIAEKALEAADAKRRRREQTEAATKARAARKAQRDDPNAPPTNDQRNVQQNVPRDVQRDDERNVHQWKGEGKGREEKGNKIGEVVARARDPDALLEARLRQAAGWQNDPAPKLAVTGEIQALIDNGTDLDLDVLPVIRELAPRCDGRSWSYFVKPIARQRDKRIAASTIITDPSQIAGAPSHERPRTQRRQTPGEAMREAIDDLKQRAAERHQP